MEGSYMAAYSATSGFVTLVEQEGKDTNPDDPPKFNIPQGQDSIVITARCTKIMLDDKILELAKTISGPAWENWTVPNINWVNGVPGCGKTTWVIKNFDAEKEVIITTTTEAAKDLRDKITPIVGEAAAKVKVRTMASVLANGFRGSNKCGRLTVDEALMNHFGSIIMAARLSGASEIVLIGDINQLPYIDRDNLFDLQYNRPNLVANISQELLCTHRNPMDVAFALDVIYSGIYSSKQLVRSMALKRYTGAQIPYARPKTLFLVHTQEEKASLTKLGYGSGTGSRVLTIHEAQGLTYDTVIAIQTRPKRMEIHNSVPHAVVAISRHTVNFVYYTDDDDDAIGKFVKRTMEVPSTTIFDHNLKMAIKKRDTTVINRQINSLNPNTTQSK